MATRGDPLPEHRIQALGASLAWKIAEPTQDRHTLARSMLREFLGAEAVFHAVCPHCGGSHGPVQARLPHELAPLVSIAYSGALVAVGVAPAAATSFGIDVEIDSRERRRAVFEAIGSAELRDWTRLEAVVKARRTGLRGEVRALDSFADAHEWIAPRERGLPELHGADITLALPGEHGIAILSVAFAPATPSVGA